MSRNFYNLLESRCFLRRLSWYAAWNDGIEECWKIGYKKRKKIYSTKNVLSTFYDDARQTSIFCLSLRKYSHITRKSMQLYSFLFSKPIIPIFQNPWFHRSIVPSFPLGAKRTNLYNHILLFYRLKNQFNAYISSQKKTSCPLFAKYHWQNIFNRQSSLSIAPLKLK